MYCIDCGFPFKTVFRTWNQMLWWSSSIVILLDKMSKARSMAQLVCFSRMPPSLYTKYWLKCLKTKEEPVMRVQLACKNNRVQQPSILPMVFRMCAICNFIGKTRFCDRHRHCLLRLKLITQGFERNMSQTWTIYFCSFRISRLHYNLTEVPVNVCLLKWMHILDKEEQGILHKDVEPIYCAHISEKLPWKKVALKTYTYPWQHIHMIHFNLWWSLQCM